MRRSLLILLFAVVAPATGYPRHLAEIAPVLPRTVCPIAPVHPRPTPRTPRARWLVAAGAAALAAGAVLAIDARQTAWGAAAAAVSISAGTLSLAAALAPPLRPPAITLTLSRSF
jgi:hypothetical protein